ncbi:cell division protein FtsQ/DivIB [Paraclostridium sordellii]|uniref:cell division protein FtsQ/DivIB n=1 Tax=Paraclostridium sordellii TaxID=1505 RepID=UPI0005E8FEE7|nr:FtsQ-type POTRA domain-containing protein [Paeniclostridium sordellii]CEO27238.1 cell division protein Fts-Q type [[Clostridium] sordellii] [Paeniclostridium sordellii]CEP85180.1 cell division protein Fts-Q type [[Clostridium] sordellii] [Paeniclostridium sordellii]
MKRTSRYKLNKRGKITIYAFIFLVILFIYIFISSSFFELKNIAVNGNEKLNINQIKKLTSIGVGKNLFQYNLKDIEENIKSNPYIKYVEVKRKIPNQLIINIKENTEDFIINLDKKYLYIQNDGLILSEKSKIENKNIPIISGLKIKEYRLKEKIKIDKSTSEKYFILMLKSLKKNNMIRELKTIDINKNFINLKTKDGIRVKLKLDSNIDYNINRLNEILINLKSEKLKDGELDLLNDKQATYLP